MVDVYMLEQLGNKSLVGEEITDMSIINGSVHS